MNILITGVGGPTPRSFSIAIKKYGNFEKLRLIATDTNNLSIGLYQKELFDVSYVVPRAGSENYWSVIYEIVEKESIDLAIILPELEVIEWSKKNEAIVLPCKVLLPSSQMAELLVDKSKMTAVLNPIGLVPDSVSFHRELCDFTHLFESLGNAFWVRSTAGTSGLGSLLIDSEASLKNWIQINPSVQEFLASTFLPGRNLACKLLYWKGKLLRAACAERVNYIMAKVAPSGITGNTSFGRLLNEPEIVDLAIKAMEKLFRHTVSEKHGFYTVDFKEDSDGVPLITEINVRHVAFTQCFAAGGANFASDTVRLLINDPTFDFNFKMYEFEQGLIFLRDVDNIPVLMKENDLIG